MLEAVSMDIIKNSPDAAKIIESLRDTGYSFETAIADVVDNSIDAGASSIDIQISLNISSEITVSIADNGGGMGRDELIRAMKYGSPNPHNQQSLGKYGLGLKTASTAFCRELSVTSRKSGSDLPLTACWDLDLVQKTNDWELKLGEPAEAAIKHLEFIAPGSSGTVVAWGKVDRILRSTYGAQDYKKADRALSRRLDNLRAHLSKVFQRYLDPDFSDIQNVTMSVNSTPLAPWDPFLIGSSELILGKEHIADVNGDRASFSIKAYILPHKSDMSEDQQKLALISNKRQGLYIYRHGRLIQDASWLDLYTQEPHCSLLRVDLSFDERCDMLLNLDIRKSQIILQTGLESFIKDFLAAPRKEAAKRYRKAQNVASGKHSQNIHGNSNQNINNHAKDVSLAKVEAVPGEKNQAFVEGQVKIHIPIYEPNKPGEIHVRPAEDLESGLLFAPALIDGKQAVEINTSHDYYLKIYIPNRKQSATIQGIDALLWALCVAELKTTSNDMTEKFNDMRFEVSHILRKLVKDLPEPNLPNDESDEK